MKGGKAGRGRKAGGKRATAKSAPRTAKKGAPKRAADGKNQRRTTRLGAVRTDDDA